MKAAMYDNTQQSTKNTISGDGDNGGGGGIK